MTTLNDIATRVIKTLTRRDVTLATAESLTGGLIGAALTSVPGASKVYMGGVIAYDTEMKVSMLGVDRQDIEAKTVVSAEVARAMAGGIHRLTGADWCIAVTGVAGPEPQMGHEPGEVWISVRGPKIGQLPPMAHTHRFQFDGDRHAIQQQTVEAALGMILRVIAPGE